MLFFRSSLGYCLLLLAIGCSTGQPAKTDASMTSPVPSAPWSLTYHDGSGNGFRFWQEAAQDSVHFTYTPITPATSSSGTYSGGSPNEGTLTDEQVADLWQNVRQLETDVSLHVDSRMMGTGTFRVETAAGLRQFMVKRGAALRGFDEIVAPFRGE